MRKSLGVLICWAFTIQDYLSKGGCRGLAAGLVDMNRNLLLQISERHCCCHRGFLTFAQMKAASQALLKLPWSVRSVKNGERKRGREWSIRSSSWIWSGSYYGKTGIWGTWSNALGSKGNLNVAKKGKHFLYWWVYVTLVCTSPLLLAPLPACGLLAGISLSCIRKKPQKTYKPQSCKTNWSSEPGVLTPAQWHSTAQPASLASSVTAQTSFKPWLLGDIYSHLQTTEGNKIVSPSAVQVLWSMCFSLNPKCTRLCYQCLFLSFTAFISYPHQPCEHFEGWVTQIRLLSAVKSIIRQQNPLTSLLFRVPT